MENPLKKTLNLLCIASYFKGVDFLKSASAQGCNVYLVTSKKLENKPWPREVLSDIYYMNQLEDGSWNLEDLKAGLAYKMRSTPIHRIVALDDFDVERAAFLREHFRIPGMGQTTARHFRDKLAMRMCAMEAGILVPPFSPLFNDEQIHQYTRQTAPPWVVKPRSEASSAGITKVHNTEELWELLNHKLAHDRHNFLIEQFTPGTVYHIDSLTVDGQVVFAQASRYLNTPFEVAHGGGIFRSCTVAYESQEEKELLKLNEQILQAFGMRFSASHTEIIRSTENGQLYFLETSSRVGGAHIAEQVAFATGVNLWEEWAKIEVAMARQQPYVLPQVKREYSGIIISLTRQEYPDDSGFTDPEICWRIQNNPYHIGFILTSNSRERILYLLDEYAQRIYSNFHASAPAPDKPAH
ncbi:ATP-grasp domain-containing protein [Sphingobacteriales bacterium UPWRP_1]|nr:ATPase [Sphingobacteriales bacterium TSM_CSS]PSJ74930.1 ATP-grasp domain-containing protein [Sphingobacteriales bacterium UPWRP_1]